MLSLWRWRPAQKVIARPARRRRGVAVVARNDAASPTLPGVSSSLPRPCCDPVDLTKSPRSRERHNGGLLERVFDGIPAPRTSALSLHVSSSPRRAPPTSPRRIAALLGPRSLTLVSWRGERIPTRIQKTPQLLKFPALAPAPGVHWSVLSLKELHLRGVPPALAASVKSSGLVSFGLTWQTAWTSSALV